MLQNLSLDTPSCGNAISKLEKGKYQTVVRSNLVCDHTTTGCCHNITYFWYTQSKNNQGKHKELEVKEPSVFCSNWS